MKTLAAALLSLSVLAGLAATPASAARLQRGDDCVVTGWTDGSWTRPVFKCPDPDQEIHHRR